MEYKKIMIIMMLAIFLFSMASVCAGDVNDTQADSEDANQMELSSNIEIAGDNLQTSEENATLTQSNDREMVGEGEVGTFSDLQSKVYGFEVTLDKDYECEDDFGSNNGIRIYYSLTIDGQGHTIDAKGKTRFFDFFSDEGDTLVLKNITFANGKSDEWAGGILIYGNCRIVNCTFVNNSAVNEGGAIFGHSGTINVSDCTFINNHDRLSSGAICSMDAIINAERCNFKTKSDLISGVNLAAHSFAFKFNEYSSGEKITFDCRASDMMLEFYRFDKLFCIYYCSGQDAIVLPYFGEDDYESVYAYDVFYSSNGSRIYVGTINIKQPAYPTYLMLSAETVYNSKDYVTVTLKEGEGYLFCGRKVIVDFNGVKTFQTDDKGQIKVPTEGLVPGVYKLHVTFNDSVSFGESEFYADITVKKAATNIISSALTTVYNEDGYLKATLKDENNQVLAGLNVTAVINGKTINLTTDSLGAVKLSTKNLVPKTYTASISFAGDGNYFKSTKSVKVTVKKATPKFVAKAKAFKLTDKTKKYIVTFKNNKNKAIKSKRVYIKVAGITYSAKTDAKGQATFKLTKLKKVGSFNAGLTFKGDAYYNKCSKSVKIVVKK